MWIADTYAVGGAEQCDGCLRWFERGQAVITNKTNLDVTRNLCMDCIATELENRDALIEEKIQQARRLHPELQSENAELKEALEGDVENWKSLNDTKIELARNLYPELRNKLMLIREAVRKVSFIGLSKPQYLEALYEIKNILGDEE